MSELSLQGSPIVAQLQVCFGITRCVQFQKRGKVCTLFCSTGLILQSMYNCWCRCFQKSLFRNKSLCLRNSYSHFGQCSAKVLPCAIPRAFGSPHASAVNLHTKI